MKLLKREDLAKLSRKKARKILTKIYDRLYKSAVRLVKDNDYCQVEKGECIRGRKVEPGSLKRCCANCKHLKDNKCSIEALTCRTHMCVPLLIKNS